MKTLIFTLVVFSFTTSTVFAQAASVLKKDIKKLNKQETVLKEKKKKDRITLRKLEGKEVSVQSKNQFYADFGDIKGVTWNRDNYYDVATFTQDGKQTKAFYDPEAELIGTIQAAKLTDLPASARKQIKKDYPNDAIDRVIFFDDNESNDTDMLLYNSQFEDEDSYFVELSGKGERIVLHVTEDGNVLFFANLK